MGLAGGRRRRGWRTVLCVAVVVSGSPPPLFQESGCFAAEVASDYEQVIAGRADKILATLDGVKPDARSRVRDVLLDFSRSLSAWHDAHGARRKELRSQADDASKADLAALDDQLAALRLRFVERLSADLTPEQVAAVKDGLTYNVLHVTERAYHEMIETLSDEQKAKIHEWLVEARELAIGEGSSESKHAVFGKFKGRINNFLSQQGYDLKQEERGWQARRKAAADAGDTIKESK
jgi:ElaB/YqjD/DUF883 family membrane-anchored ribosome-binding protein